LNTQYTKTCEQETVDPLLLKMACFGAGSKIKAALAGFTEFDKLENTR